MFWGTMSPVESSGRRTAACDAPLSVTPPTSSREPHVEASYAASEQLERDRVVG
jgi:hypothetical protein